MSKLALKRLTASDLTLFEWHFKNETAGHQKAINLNRNPFIDELFPSLPEIATKSGGRISVALSLFGPGSRGEYNLQRKIVKFGAYKNWRLDGEFIFNPQDDPERFNVLKPNDLALMEFVGEGVPYSMKAFFIAQGVAEDETMHAALDELLGSERMAAITPEELAAAANDARVAEAHPVRQLLPDGAIEDAALGGVEGPRKLRQSGRRVSRTELLRARAAADECGQRGEEFVNAYLASLGTANKITSYEWISDSNAVAPYDFRATFAGKSKPTAIEVKSTTGEFDRNVHISMNELLAMASEDDYRLFRVYKMSDDDTAKMRVATDVRDMAVSLLTAFEQLPNDVTVDGVTLKPGLLKFSDEIVISLAEEEEDGEGPVQAVVH